MTQSRPSCKTIALAAGVSRMTVSMALRDHPRVAPETRRRIKEIARQQGYTPDPNLTQLMRYLRKRNISKEEPVIAILNARMRPLAQLGRDSVIIREGARERAEELGFKSEDFWINEPGMRLQRVVQILQARGIRGILVLPVEHLRNVFSLPQEDFVGVATCSVAAKLGFNQVHPHFYQSMHIGISSLVAKGFRRIGLCFTTSDDERANHLYQSYLLYYQGSIPARDRVAPLTRDTITPSELQRWVRKHRPDVVLSTNIDHCDWLREAGWSVPDDISFAALAPTTEEVHDIAQVRVGYRKIGATAIDILKTKLANEPLGPADNPAVTLIRGEWVDGATVCSPEPTAATASA